MVTSSSFAEMACCRLVLAVLGIVGDGWLVAHIVYISRSEFQDEQQFFQLLVQIVLHKYILFSCSDYRLAEFRQPLFDSCSPLFHVVFVDIKLTSRLQLSPGIPQALQF